MPAPATTNPKAVWSLVLGIASMVLCPLTGIVGLILGFGARKEVRESQGRQTGDGMALTGIITSIIGVFVMGLALLSIVAVTFLGQAADEKFEDVGDAISTEGPYGTPIDGLP